MSMDTVFIASEAKTNLANAITKLYGSFFLAFEIERSSGVIVDFDCTHTLDVTSRFLKKVFVGKNIVTDFNEMKEDILESYLGSSQKAIVVAMTDVMTRFTSLAKR